jgi:hypothetical protein
MMQYHTHRPSSGAEDHETGLGSNWPEGHLQVWRPHADPASLCSYDYHPTDLLHDTLTHWIGSCWWYIGTPEPDAGTYLAVPNLD